MSPFTKDPQFLVLKEDNSTESIDIDKIPNTFNLSRTTFYKNKTSPFHKQKDNSEKPIRQKPKVLNTSMTLTPI